MQEESSDCEGIVDVGVIVLAHFDNPAKDEALLFLKEVFEQKRRLLIPVSAFAGAYHVMTRYLRIPQAEAAAGLSRTLSLNSQAYYEHIRKEDILDAFGYSLSYKVEIWDSFMLSLARRFGTRNIFSIDEELKKRAAGFTVINPIQQGTMKKYHRFIAGLK